MFHFLRTALAIGILGGFLAACAIQQQERVAAKAASSQTKRADGPVSGEGGATLVDNQNRWRGAVIGAAWGGVVRGTPTQMLSRATVDAVAANRPVIYETTDGWQRVEAHPQGIGRPGCRKVRERIYQNGQLVRQQIRETCPK